MKLNPLAIAAVCGMAALTALSATLKNPAFRMTEAELLAVLKENGLNDKVTACQELSHVASAASVPTLAALLTDASEPALFLAAQFALENVPGPEAKTALENALKTVKDAKRRGGLEKSLAARANPIPDGYAGASEKLTAFPPKNVVQRGEISAVPALVKTALGKGFGATLARRHLVGFPNCAVEDEMMKLVRGHDVKKARLAVEVLGERQARGRFAELCALARSTKNAALRNEVFKAFAAFCNADDMPALLQLLEEMPGEDRLVGAIVHVGANAFRPDNDSIEVLKALYGAFGAKNAKGKPLVADVTAMVKVLVAGGSRTIVSGNRLAGRGGFAHDPAPGKRKALRLTYRRSGGPAVTLITPETQECELVGRTLDKRIAAPLVDACRNAKGQFRAALVKIIGALERKGEVPGADDVLFRPIFNGRDLTGWSQQDGYFSVKDGVIVGASTPEHPCKPNHHLVYTAETFTDFELRGEFRLSRGANSGIQLRCRPQYVGDNGYQADMNGGGNYVGFLYHPRQHLVGERGADVTLAADNAKTVTRFADGASLGGLYRVEQWNDIRIKVAGRTITVWINGVRTTSVEDAREKFFPASGHIALQLHQGPPMTVEFRNLRVR
jgi:hypothetical protein